MVARNDGKPKFTTQERAEIRKRYRTTEVSMQALADEYKVALSTMRRVVRGRNAQDRKRSK